jgi:hypothetical protein
MRKALFGVILVASSFAGGAVVNGPGLRWAQAMVMERLGMEAEGEKEKSPGVMPEGIAPLAAEPSEVSADRDKDKPKEKDREKDKDATTSGAKLASVSKPSSQPEPDPLPDVKSDPAPLTSADPPAPLSAGVDAAVSPTSNKPASATATPTEPAAGPGQGDWAEIRRGLKAAGVSRYGMEGEPGGRVRFQCVIPVVGRRAVGQHFEAEGDDELQAARAVLKRITLWRATEADGHEP